jgi:hypothetical protein
MKTHKHNTLMTLALAIGIGTLLSSSALAAAVRLSVTDKLNKDRTSEKSESEKSSSRTKVETLTYDLNIQVSNTTKAEGTFDLEWYFIKRPLDDEGKKGDPILCEKDKTTLTIGGQKRISHKVTSKALKNTESKSSKSSSGNSSKSSGSSKSFSGDTYAGYVVLARQDGKILAKYSNEKKFLEDSWVEEKLNGKVSQGSSKNTSSSSKKKRKKKNK